jgi:hypothetical protein
MNSHSLGEIFVILDVDTVRRAVQNTTDLDVQRFLKVVGAGLSGFNAPVTPFINTGVSQKPWQPVQIQGARDGSDNLTITWNRRSRIGHQRIISTSPPLGENNERYEVDILTGAGTVIRLIEVTTPTAVYLESEQSSDFGSAQTVVSVAIYQLSTVVDRGYPGRALI